MKPTEVEVVRFCEPIAQKRASQWDGLTPEDRCDAVQGAMAHVVSVYQQDKWCPSRPWEPFYTKVTLNKTSDECTRLGNQRRGVVPLPAVPVVRRGSDPIEKAADQELPVLLDEIFAAVLSEEETKVVRWHLGGLSHPEIAVKLGWVVEHASKEDKKKAGSRVSRVFRRALAKLKHPLQKSGFGNVGANEAIG